MRSGAPSKRVPSSTSTPAASEVPSSREACSSSPACSIQRSRLELCGSARASRSSQLPSSPILRFRSAAWAWPWPPAEIARTRWRSLRACGPRVSFHSIHAPSSAATTATKATTSVSSIGVSMVTLLQAGS
jgi:hypothetical protein